MIKIYFDNAGEKLYQNWQDAKDDIIDFVVNKGDTICEIEDEETGKHYSCYWSLELQEED